MKRIDPIRLVMTALCMLTGVSAISQQNPDETIIKKFTDNALVSYESYDNLQWLCKHTAGRICGSPQAAAAVEFTRQVMDKMGLDSVWLQPVWVKSWNRGAPERAQIVSTKLGTFQLPACALGWSVGTGPAGLAAQVVEIQSQDDLKHKQKSDLEGRIIFFNQPMKATEMNTFTAYGEAAWQRSTGPAEAAKMGAIACVIRSLSIEKDDYPHTGITHYAADSKAIPAIAISTNAADLLSAALLKDPNLNVFIRTTCMEGPEVLSNNVIGEIRGTDYPNEIITIGGHIDAWELAEGAHDDGAGCFQSIEVLRLFKALGIRPKHTIRAVMFMDEEVAQRGGQAYAKIAAADGEKHIAALESDRGVFQPRAVAVNGNTRQMDNFARWQPLFEPYNLNLVKGGGGVDIGPLKKYYPDILYMGFIPDDQRYFELHHSTTDTFEKINRREMQLGAAAMAALVYLYDKYGL